MRGGRVAAAALLMATATGCSAEGPSPADGSARPSPSASPARTGGPVERWDAGDLSCAGPARVKAADAPKALKVSVPSHWIGAGNLWIEPPSLVRSTGLGVKYGSVTLDARGRSTDAAGPPQVTAERVDGTGTAKGATGGFAREAPGSDSPGSFWPTTLSFSAPGCWLVSETSGRTTLRFLMRVV